MSFKNFIDQYNLNESLKDAINPNHPEFNEFNEAALAAVQAIRKFKNFKDIDSVDERADSISGSGINELISYMMIPEKTRAKLKSQYKTGKVVDFDAKKVKKAAENVCKALQNVIKNADVIEDYHSMEQITKFMKFFADYHKNV